MGCPFSRPQHESSINEHKPLLLPYNYQQQDNQQQKRRSNSINHNKTSVPVSIPPTLQTSTSPVTVTPSENQENQENENHTKKRRPVSFTSDPQINNMENSLKLYRCIREFDRTMNGTRYLDYFTELDEPLPREKALSGEIVGELARRTRVTQQRAKKAIIQNEYLVRDAFSQIITEKIQEIMDQCHENVFMARKSLCEHGNDVNRAIEYCQSIRALEKWGRVSRQEAVTVYYRHQCHMEHALREVLAQRLSLLEVKKKVVNADRDTEQLLSLLLRLLREHRSITLVNGENRNGGSGNCSGEKMDYDDDDDESKKLLDLERLAQEKDFDYDRFMQLLREVVNGNSNGNGNNGSSGNRKQKKNGKNGSGGGGGGASNDRSFSAHGEGEQQDVESTPPVDQQYAVTTTTTTTSAGEEQAVVSEYVEHSAISECYDDQDDRARLLLPT